MSPTTVVDPVTDADLETVPLERLEAEIAGWNAQLSAATCRWLLLIGEFDRRTARERVRVARSLPDLPVTRSAFARGELSYKRSLEIEETNRRGTAAAASPAAARAAISTPIMPTPAGRSGPANTSISIWR